MSKHFTLSIKMGNDAMQTGEDVAGALRDAANYIEQRDQGSLIIDANGNTVGNFHYFEQEEGE